MLTKEQIESMHTLLVRERPMGTSVAAVDELCRLALLGLERDERQAVTSEQAAKDIKELRGIAGHLVLALPTEAERDAMRACIDYCAGGLKRSSTPQIAGNYLYRVDAILSMLSRAEDSTKEP